MNDKDILKFWEEDKDWEKVSIFFNEISADEKLKNKIKDLTLLKIEQKPEESTPIQSDKSSHKLSFIFIIFDDLRNSLKSFKLHHYALAFSVLILITIVGLIESNLLIKDYSMDKIQEDAQIASENSSQELNQYPSGQILPQDNNKIKALGKPESIKEGTLNPNQTPDFNSAKISVKEKNVTYKLKVNNLSEALSKTEKIIQLLNGQISQLKNTNGEIIINLLLPNENFLEFKNQLKEVGLLENIGESKAMSDNNEINIDLIIYVQ